MTRDDIVRMAREAGIVSPEETGEVWCAGEWQLLEFAKLIAAAEREECAKTVLEWLHGDWHNQGVVAAMMIRERGAP